MSQPTETKYSKPNAVLTILLDIVFFSIPLVGTIIVIIKTINCFTKTTEPIYGDVPIKVSDRRHSTGYRIEGYKKGKVGSRPLTNDEIQNLRTKGKYHLLFWAGLIIAGLIYYYTTKK